MNRLFRVRNTGQNHYLIVATDKAEAIDTAARAKLARSPRNLKAFDVTDEYLGYDGGESLREVLNTPKKGLACKQIDCISGQEMLGYIQTGVMPKKADSKWIVREVK